MCDAGLYTVQRAERVPRGRSLEVKEMTSDRAQRAEEVECESERGSRYHDDGLATKRRSSSSSRRRRRRRRRRGIRCCDDEGGGAKGSAARTEEVGGAAGGWSGVERSFVEDAYGMARRSRTGMGKATPRPPFFYGGARSQRCF